MASSAYAPPGALQLVSDYEEMRSLMTYGLYVIPDSVDLSLWHGLINVREGRYHGGSFRFIICAHPLYPADGARPLVVFLDKPYHPLVDSVTGALQIEARFTTWRGGVDRLPPVVELLREVLTTDLVLVPPSGKAYNQDAARLYRANTTEFDARAQRSAAAASAAAIKRGHALSPRGIGGQVFPPAVYSRSYLPGSERGDDTVTAVVAGVEYTADGGDRFAYERSPFTAAVAVVGASGTLSTDGQRVATLAAAIGRARGFRMSEPSMTHEALLAEIQSGQVRVCVCVSLSLCVCASVCLCVCARSSLVPVCVRTLTRLAAGLR
jgi:ubiquitin-protein ligase